MSLRAVSLAEVESTSHRRACACYGAGVHCFNIAIMLEVTQCAALRRPGSARRIVGGASGFASAGAGDARDAKNQSCSARGHITTALSERWHRIFAHETSVVIAGWQ